MTGSPCPASVLAQRKSDSAGAYRVIYVARFNEAVYVLHAFQKKTQKTAQKDLALAALRYRQVWALARKE
jgi:phage-related protein